MCDMCPMSKKEELKMWEAELDNMPRRRKALEHFERFAQYEANRLRLELTHGEPPG